MKFIGATLLLLLLAGVASAEQAGIPAAYPESRYGAAWGKNPFLKVVGKVAQRQVTFADDWTLSGMAEYDGKIRVTIVNKHTGERRHVTDQEVPDAEFRLVRTHFSRIASDASADIMKDGQTAKLKYSLTK